MIGTDLQGPALDEARRHFDRAIGAWGDDRVRDAGDAYLASAAALRLAPEHAAAEVVYNRRVAYANAVNSWLSIGLTEEPRQALLAASEDDAALAPALRQAADAIPRPMSCVAPTR